jgi:hypothetical protein
MQVAGGDQLARYRPPHIGVVKKSEEKRAKKPNLIFDVTHEARE